MLKKKRKDDLIAFFPVVRKSKLIKALALLDRK
jgi:hypothetical protein